VVSLPEHRSDAWPAAEDRRLVDALEALAQGDHKRIHRLVQRANDLLPPGQGPLAFAQIGDLRSDLFALVERITYRYLPLRDLQALKNAARDLGPGTIALLDLEELVGELAPEGRLAELELRPFLECVGDLRAGVGAARIKEAVLAARCDFERPGLKGTESLVETVLRLNDGAGEEHDAGCPVCSIEQGSPLLLRFLAELAGRMTAGDDRARLCAALRAGVYQLYPRERWKAVLAALEPRFDTDGKESCASVRRVLQVRLREISSRDRSAALYEPDAALYIWPEGEGLCNPVHSPPPKQNAYTRDELSERGNSMFGTWLELVRSLGDHSESRIEFLLPWSLLDFPVEKWLLRAADDFPEPLGWKHLVVLRSLERAERNSSGYRDSWKQRWRAGHSGDEQGADGHAPDEHCRNGNPGGKPDGRAKADVHRIWQRMAWMAVPETGPPDEWNPPEGPDVIWVGGKESEMRRWLLANGRHAGLVLGFSFQSMASTASLRAVHRQVLTAVYEGLPVMLWCRDGADAGKLARLLAEDPALRFEGIPAALRDWRYGAEEDDPEDVRDRISLLWDDPDCILAEGTLLTGPATG
jgi:hypothetical protein